MVSVCVPGLLTFIFVTCRTSILGPIKGDRKRRGKGDREHHWNERDGMSSINDCLASLLCTYLSIEIVVLYCILKLSDVVRRLVGSG